jgi:uncharacterized protein YqeY
MSLLESISDDMKDAMRSKDSDRLSTLRMAKAALMNEQNKNGADYVLSDDEIVKVLQTLVKQRKDAADQYKSGGREDLAEKELSEITVLQRYLPREASDDEINAAVSAAIAETGAGSIKDMGTVMKAAMVKLSGMSVDGKKVNEAVRSSLS